MFNDLKIGDIVYKVIFANDSGYILNVRMERVTHIEVVHSGTILKTEDVLDELPGMHGYFVDPIFYNSKLIYQGSGNDEIYWDKGDVEKLIKETADECQVRFNGMLEYINRIAN